MPRIVRWLRAVLTWRGVDTRALDIVRATDAVRVGIQLGEAPTAEEYYHRLLAHHGLGPRPAPALDEVQDLDAFVRSWRKRGLIAPEAVA